MNNDLREKIYSMSNSFLPLDTFYNDIELNSEKNYDKEKAFKDLEIVADFIQDLQKQLAKKDNKIIQFELQLAEKDKDIERFMSMKNREQLVNENGALKDTIAIVLAQKRNVVKHKKQLAIQELEKTLNFIENVFDKALKNCSLNNGYYDQILDFIDQQIKELKRGKNVEN